MLGILVLLACSWLLLFLVHRESLLALGFLPILQRLKQFGIGFLVTATLCTVVQFIEIQLSSAAWSLNDAASFGLMLEMFYWDLKSVVTEELIFRGALLYVLVRKIGTEKSILISALAFGVYHWFSFGIFGNIVPMVVVFLGTGLMGYAWAMAFTRTGSVMMPIGMHLGWNFFLNSIFSNGPLGQGLILKTGGTQISDWYSLVGLWLVPVIVWLFVRRVVGENEKFSLHQ